MAPGSDSTGFQLGGRVDAIIGLRLSRFRADAGMTLAEAAAALGIPGPTLAAFENGSMRVSAGLLIMMGRLYGFTHVELFRSLL